VTGRLTGSEAGDDRSLLRLLMPALTSVPCSRPPVRVLRERTTRRR
jgi:hypothetical protein